MSVRFVLAWLIGGREHLNRRTHEVTRLTEQEPRRLAQLALGIGYDGAGGGDIDRI